MTGGLTLGAALMLGFAASGHCLVMCGGISAALGLATAKRADGKPRTSLLVAYQVGRMLSYAIAGGLLGGVLGFVVGWLDEDAVRQGLRALSAVALVAAALVAFGVLRDPGSRIGRLVWPRLAPLGRRLLPVTNVDARPRVRHGVGMDALRFRLYRHGDCRARARRVALGGDDARVRHRHGAGDDRGRVRRAARRGFRRRQHWAGASRVRC